MKFLLDADLPQWMVEAFARAGHEAVHAEDVGLSHFPDAVIAEHARDGGRCIVSGDFDFSDIRNYPPARYNGIIVLWIPRHAGSPYMRRLLGELFAFISPFTTLAGKLLIVEPGRIRVRE